MSDKVRQSAAKALSSNEYETGSQTIANASTPLSNKAETGDTQTSKVEGEDIVEIRFRKFLEKSKEKFNNLFDFSNAIYVNAKTKIKIKCKEHNFIFEQTPDKHLQSTHSCPKCLLENKKPNLNPKLKECLPFEHYKNILESRYKTNFEYVSGKGG